MVERGSPDTVSAGTAPRRPRSAGPRRVVWFLAVSLGLVGLGATALVALRHPAVATGVVNAVLGRMRPSPGTVVSVGEVRGDWLTGLEFHRLRMARGDTILVAVDTVRMRYRIASLLKGILDLRGLELEGVLVTSDLVTTNTSRELLPKHPITLADVLRGRFYSGPRIHVDRLTVRRASYRGQDGQADSGVIFTDIGIQARRLRLGGEFSWLLDSLGARGRRVGTVTSPIELGLAATLSQGRLEARSIRLESDSSSIRGGMTLAIDRRDSLAEARFVLQARPLALRDLAALASTIGLEGVVTIDIDVRGTRVDRLSGTMAIAADHARWGSVELEDVRIGVRLTDGRSDARGSALCGRARTEVQGWVRPFDGLPTYDFEARSDRLPDGIQGVAWWSALAERASPAVTVRVQGAGFTQPVASVRARATGGIGDVDFDGRLDLTNGIGWDVRQLTFEKLKIARLIGDTTASNLSGTLTVSGWDAATPSRRLVAELVLRPSSYGPWQIASCRARAKMNGAEVAGSLEIETQDGTLVIDSMTGRIRGLDSPNRAPAAHGGRLSGAMRVDLGPSRFGHREITGGSLDLSAAEGVVKVDGSFATMAGRLDVSGRARPFDAVPSYNLDRARFSDVDLGAWAGAPALRSRLSGSIAGHGRSGSKGDWDATLILAPSSMGDADLEGGEVRASPSGPSSGRAWPRSRGSTSSRNSFAAARSSHPRSTRRSASERVRVATRSTTWWSTSTTCPVSATRIPS
jgi:hypothetical protein